MSADRRPAARPRCYVASPLGFSEAGRHYYREVYLPALARVVTPVDPWALTTEQEVAEAHRRGEQRAMSLEIGRRNSAAIRGCSLLAAFLDGQEPDAGTVAEVGYAAGVGLTCFGLRTDFREAGEAGVVVNLQVESFVVESGGRICRSLDELVAALAAAPVRLPSAA
ncbi:MAG TPA: nucleoside 2-deoxyribosyltransferase [Solirubrobacteraceae bacterium]|nr:nucleoside 2-deoxyribosyltransferase [Solirubrobacteraceae bacterium]